MEAVQHQAHLSTNHNHSAQWVQSVSQEGVPVREVRNGG